jgi:O-antigen/teichoic acid export membrane protein
MRRCALCVALVPRFGGHCAVAATSVSLAFETVLLFAIVRRPARAACAGVWQRAA